MFWTNFLLDACLVFFTWGGTTWCEPLEQPLAHLDADCSSLQVAGTNVERIGVDFNRPTPAANPTIMPVAYPVQPMGYVHPAQCWATPVQPAGMYPVYSQPPAPPAPVVTYTMPMCPNPSLCAPSMKVVRSPELETYEVQVTLPSNSCSSSNTSKASMLISSNGAMAVPVTLCDSKQHFTTGMVSTSVRPAGYECITLELTVRKEGSKPGAIKVFSGTQMVKLDLPTGMVLHGDEPDPCCVEVLVQRRTNTRTQAALPQPMQCPYAMSAPPRPYTSTTIGYRPVPYSALPTPPLMNSCPLPAAQPACVAQVLPEPLPVPTPQSQTCYPTPVQPVSAVVSVTPLKKVTYTQVALTQEKGKSKLKLDREALCSTCVRISMKAGEAGMVTLAAGKTHVHIVGKGWKASADQIEMHDNGLLIFTGHVKLVSDKVGVCASVKADRLCVEVHNGTVEKIVSQKAKN